MASAQLDFKLPKVPVRHADFLHYLSGHPEKALHELLQPYKEYDAVLRRIFAQDVSNPIIKDNHLNLLPLYHNNEAADAKVRARQLTDESEDFKQKFVMPLADDARKPRGSPAVVPTIKDFQQNFNVFSESSLVDMDWSNVVAAGSSVVTSLLPVPEEYSGSKRNQRTYYHEVVAPASDVDLFIYGLSEEEAVEKIKSIERSIRDAILEETTTIRTKNAITIASRYPVRHVQIVLRRYKSVSEILTGFDVDCSCAAYDGKQVYVAPRALVSYMSQINMIDLTRRSPSYENRLSKYSHRGFEIFCPDLDRSCIDPTIFERSFGRTVGLARLLILEKLPNSSDRDAYIDQRRRERGRPQVNRYNRWGRGVFSDNVKEGHEDEVAEWVEQDEVSDYHTFTIPYGVKFSSKKIEKLLYTKDLLLNAEWNKPKDREVALHRHPAFFGNVEDVIEDCCGFCPQPTSDEEREVAEEESKIYVSGRMTFIEDDPGRQTIGSFNPITDSDWTEMAYIGNTSRLMSAIVESDIEHVQDWLSQEDTDPNRRDFTGRTPLHLASMVSTPEIVQALIDHGARMIARLADGRTALHLAAARGSAEIVKKLLVKSEENAEVEAQKDEMKREVRMKQKRDSREQVMPDAEQDEDDVDGDIEMLSDYSGEDSDGDDGKSRTTGSFVKVKSEEANTAHETLPEDENTEDPDIYDIDVLSWDLAISPLHTAILNGHIEVVQELVGSFGADVMLPIKLFNDYGDRSPKAAILTLVLAMTLPIDKAKAMTTALLELGASSGQADMRQKTPLFFIAAKQPALLDVVLEKDGPAVQRAINHLATGDYHYDTSRFSALMVAINEKNAVGALKLLTAGARPEIGFEEYSRSITLYMPNADRRTSDQNRRDYGQQINQPLVTAIKFDQVNVALELLERGADPNTLTPAGHMAVRGEQWTYVKGETVLDIVKDKLKALREYEYKPQVAEITAQEVLALQDYLGDFTKGSYQHWVTWLNVDRAHHKYENDRRNVEKQNRDKHSERGVAEKNAAVQSLLTEFERLEAKLVQMEAQRFYDLHSEMKPPTPNNNLYSHREVKREKTYRFSCSFQIPNSTDVSKDGYTKLFEAAWSGDLTTIKSLTLAPWGSEEKHDPLQIAIKDQDNFSPLSIALLRGHRDVARGILDIARLQYQGLVDEKKKRYRLATEEDSDYDSDEDSDDNVRIYGELVDEDFTMDILQEAGRQVKSTVPPITMLQWNYFYPTRKRDDDSIWTEYPEISAFGRLDPDKANPTNNMTPICHAILADNLDLLQFLLSLAEEHMVKSDENDTATHFEIDDNSFRTAIKHGRTRILAELVRSCGAGLPLDMLAKKSGVEVKEKPKFYQGLSVHGKKRKDWAAAGRHMHAGPVHRDSPLSMAAFDGCLESVDWFTTSALRHYLEFAEAHSTDKRLQVLAQAKGGFEKSIRTWLESGRHLLMHLAVMAEPTRESAELISHLIRETPEALESKSIEGYTPLAIAYATHRTEAAKLLVAAGANQAVRDKKGKNLLHLLLVGLQDRPHGRNTVAFKKLLALLDARLIPSMIVERCSLDPGSLTPLAHFLHKWQADGTEAIDIVSQLLDFSAPHSNEELNLLNGAGNSLLHDLVRWGHTGMLDLCLARRPDLVERENATGATPTELAEVLWTNHAVSHPPSIAHNNMYWGHQDNSVALLSKHVSEFDPARPTDTPDNRPTSRRIYDLCLSTADSHPSRRKLVSLVEANEVAKRIASSKNRSSYARHYGRSRRDRDDLPDEDPEEAKEQRDLAQDEVTHWSMQAMGWDENMHVDEERRMEERKRKREESDLSQLMAEEGRITESRLGRDV